ncbi:MAG: DsrE/DsrF/DrsH-like family protein [bacterium]
MADKLLIIMVNTDPSNPSELGAPFFQATIAAAMEYSVEIVMTGRAGELARRGFAEAIYVHGNDGRTIYDLIKDAHEAGVHFKVCTPTLDLWGENLIPEVEEIIGGAYVISEAMDENTVSFTY